MLIVSIALLNSKIDMQLSMCKMYKRTNFTCMYVCEFGDRIQVTSLVQQEPLLSEPPLESPISPRVPLSFNHRTMLETENWTWVLTA